MNTPFIVKSVLVLLLGLLFLIIYYLINIGNKYIDRKQILKLDRKFFFSFLIIGGVIYLFYIIINKYYIVKEMLGIIFFSIVASYLLSPLIDLIEKRNVNRIFAILIVYIIVIGVVVIISISIVPKIAKEFKNLVSVFPSYMEKVTKFIDDIYNKYYDNVDSLPPQLKGIEEALIENTSKLELFITKNIKKIINSVFNVFSKVVGFITVPILTFYFLKDKEYFKKKVYLTVPKKYRMNFKKMLKEIDKALGEFIRGRIIVAIYVGISTTILLFILKIDFALVIGMVAGLADIIPYFGPVIGIIPAVFFAFLESPIKALWVVILFTGIQQIENNIITPKIIGESMGIHPVVVIISLIIGGGIFGILGMVFAVPIVAILKIFFSFCVETFNTD